MKKHCIETSITRASGLSWLYPSSRTSRCTEQTYDSVWNWVVEYFILFFGLTIEARLRHCLGTVCEKGELCDVLQSILLSSQQHSICVGRVGTPLVLRCFCSKSILLVGLSRKTMNWIRTVSVEEVSNVLRISPVWTFLHAKSPVLSHDWDRIDSIDVPEVLMKSNNFVLNLWEPLPCYGSSLGIDLFTRFHWPSIDTTPSSWWFEKVVVPNLDPSPLVRTRFRESYSSIAMSDLLETVKSHDDSVPRTYGDSHWTVFYLKRSNFYLHKMDHL